MPVVRFPDNPIIRPEMLPGRDGDNINGPSLIRVPDWLEEPLGTYYLYFAHHNGTYIRMAYADHLAGPWTIFEPGTLTLEQAPGCVSHIASPDVHVDNERRAIRMYFHGPSRVATGHGPGQRTFVAVSSDGLRFRATDEILGNAYWRAFHWEDWWYAMGRHGLLHRSRDGLTQFEAGPNPFPSRPLLAKVTRRLTRAKGRTFTTPSRHLALHRTDRTLRVYFSDIGDAPERIRRTELTLVGDWTRWKVSTPEDVLRPEQDWEGARLPIARSSPGAATEPENALRDPAIFVEDGRVYLLYAVAGESGIALAECSTTQ